MDNFIDDKSVNRGRKLNDIWAHFDRQRAISTTGKSTRFTGKCKYCHNVFPGTLNTLRDHINKCSQFATLHRRISAEDELSPPEFNIREDDIPGQNLYSFENFPVPPLNIPDPINLLKPAPISMKFESALPSLHSSSIDLDMVLEKAEMALKERRSEVITSPRQFGVDLDYMFSIMPTQMKS